jgi:ligand-binding SRPBCC domain-containing protein
VTHFELTTYVAAARERVFDACLDIDLHTASMAGSGERAVGGVTSGRLGLGDRVTFEARHLGIRWRMAARVTELDRPAYFVDEQERGPFKRWHHAHYFAPDGAGGTVMRDIVEFTSPCGPLGSLVERLVLRTYMIRLIQSRNQYLSSQLPDM